MQSSAVYSSSVVQYTYIWNIVRKKLLHIPCFRSASTNNHKLNFGRLYLQLWDIQRRTYTRSVAKNSQFNLFICFPVSKFSQNYWSDLCENFTRDVYSGKKVIIKFWKLFRSESESRNFLTGIFITVEPSHTRQRRAMFYYRATLCVTAVHLPTAAVCLSVRHARVLYPNSWSFQTSFSTR